MASLIVCLPPDAVPDRRCLVEHLVAALHPHVAVPAGVLDGGHFLLWHQPDPVESALLLLTDPDPQVPGLVWCAGGPVGLLDLAAATAHIHQAVVGDLASWREDVAGTPPAFAWWHYLDRYRADPHNYPLHAAVAEFAAQPRIAAMILADGAPYGRDMYGPGLEALHAGADCYADYRAGLLTYGDGLIRLDGRLLRPVSSPILVEQTLPDRQLYHQQARGYVDALDPAVVLAAVRCFR